MTVSLQANPVCLKIKDKTISPNDSCYLLLEINSIFFFLKCPYDFLFQNGENKRPWLLQWPLGVYSQIFKSKIYNVLVNKT